MLLNGCFMNWEEHVPLQGKKAPQPNYITNLLSGMRCLLTVRNRVPFIEGQGEPYYLDHRVLGVNFEKNYSVPAPGNCSLGRRTVQSSGNPPE